MRISETDVVWFPYPHQPPLNVQRVRLERSQSNWQKYSNEYWMPAGRAFDLGFRGAANKTEERFLPLLSLFILFNTLVMRDRIVAREVHEAFLGIEEYRKHISLDIPGAHA